MLLAFSHCLVALVAAQVEEVSSILEHCQIIADSPRFIDGTAAGGERTRGPAYRQRPFSAVL